MEVSLNGEEYSDSGKSLRHYRHPKLSAISPAKGSASQSQVITVTRTTATESGEWLRAGEQTVARCRFEAVVLLTGKRQVQYKTEVNATIADDTELQCDTPVVDFVAPVHVEVTLNGQQFPSGGPTFFFEDNWHPPAVSGVHPRGALGWRARVDSIAYYFGGEDGAYSGAGSGYSDEFWALHLDAMHDFYPSEHQRDVAWQKLSLASGGVSPSPRSYASLSAWATTLILFGGVSSPYGGMHNDTFEFNTKLNVWQQAAVSGGPISPRSQHTAVVLTRRTARLPTAGRASSSSAGGAWNRARACMSAPP